MGNTEGQGILGLLRSSPILTVLPQEALERLALHSKTEHFRPRQVVYLPGDRSQGVFFLSAGRIKVSKVTRDGKELTLAYRAGGEFFGESCLVETGPRVEMAESMDNSEVVELPREVLNETLALHASAAFRLAQELIQRQRSLETKMEQLVFKDVGSKLAELLLSLGDEHGVQNQLGVALGVKITHQEMANLIGSTRETVSLTLSQFKRKGLIATEGRRVILSDSDGLRTLA